MAQFAEIRRRLARFRRRLETLLVAEAFVLGVLMLAAWLWTSDAFWLLLAVLAIVVPFIGILTLRRDLRPEQDLQRTVRVLNRKKKFYRKRLGIHFRFSQKWFPFGEVGFARGRKRSDNKARPESTGQCRSDQRMGIPPG
jgi:hypothetical protein